jgi:hypothetical protein
MALLDPVGKIANRIADQYRRLGFSLDVRQRLFAGLADLLDTKVHLPVALTTLADIEARGNPKSTATPVAALQDWNRALEEGKTLADAVRPWISAEEATLLQAFERGGRLSDGLRTLARDSNLTRGIVGTFVADLVDPLFLVVSSVALLIGMDTGARDTFARLAPAENWSPALSGFMAFAEVVSSVAPVIGTVIVVGLPIALLTRESWTGSVRRRFDKLLPWSLFELLSGFRLVSAYIALKEAKLKDLDIVVQLREQASPWLQERLDAAEGQFSLGAQNLGDALFRARYLFPTYGAVAMLRLYGSMPEHQMIDGLGRLPVQLSEMLKFRVKAIGAAITLASYAFFLVTTAWMLLATMTLNFQ